MRGLTGVVLSLLSCHLARAIPFTQTPLPYASDALEPYFKKASVDAIHAHHGTYVEALNKVLVHHTSPGDAKALASYQEFAANADSIRQNAGGLYNHELFMINLAPREKSSHNDISLELMEKIKAAFQDIEGLKKAFTQHAMRRFGSGWVWLGVKFDKTLDVTSTANNDNPLMQLEYPYTRMLPILGLDLWEHAYFLDYPDKRADYIEAFWNIINWKQVSVNFDKYASKGAVVPPEVHKDEDKPAEAEGDQGGGAVMAKKDGGGDAPPADAPPAEAEGDKEDIVPSTPPAEAEGDMEDTTTPPAEAEGDMEDIVTTTPAAEAEGDKEEDDSTTEPAEAEGDKGDQPAEVS